ncbi:hypothetical protein [Streptomyces sp. NPDC059909]|uniref:hypothetical protein n=1 Tax=Streptomyces sp. NPDC059909 TaxID=3346998 RepID=UPI003665214B
MNEDRTRQEQLAEPVVEPVTQPEPQPLAEAGARPAPAPEAQPEAAPVAGPEPVAEPGRKPSRVRRLLATVLPSVLVLGAVAGGITYTGLAVDRADRTAPTTIWGPADDDPAEDPASSAGRGRASTPLSKKLLPVPPGYRLGPDVESYGNDGEIGDKAAALLKEGGRGLSGKKRRDFDKRIDRMGVKGIAMRSFASDANDLIVEVQIMQMKDKKRIHDLFELRTELAEALEFPKGPKIKDHKKSACFLMPQGNEDGEDKDKSDLEAMSCSSYDSELFVSVTAFGTKPFDKSAVAELVKKQLDHIASPGEYV